AWQHGGSVGSLGFLPLRPAWGCSRAPPRGRGKRKRRTPEEAEEAAGGPKGAPLGAPAARSAASWAPGRPRAVRRGGAAADPAERALARARAPRGGHRRAEKKRTRPSDARHQAPGGAAVGGPRGGGRRARGLGG
ncbi:unnamed protein product, partial [Prorocentrum cordatum]